MAVNVYKIIGRIGDKKIFESITRIPIPELPIPVPALSLPTLPSLPSLPEVSIPGVSLPSLSLKPPG